MRCGNEIYWLGERNEEGVSYGVIRPYVEENGSDLFDLRTEEGDYVIITRFVMILHVFQTCKTVMEHIKKVFDAIL